MENLFLIFTTRLESAGFRYMITGAAASVLYGEPRLTNDVDIVLQLRRSETQEIERAFPNNEFYCPPVEVIKLEMSRENRGHFNVLHHSTGFKADIYLSGRDELHNWALMNRKRVRINEHEIWVAPPEYVIVRKLEYFREGHAEKHLRDISGMIALSADRMDLTKLDELVSERGLENEWQKAKDFRQD